MRKLFIIILFGLMLATDSRAQLLFTFENEMPVPGEALCINVAVSNFNDIVAMQMSFHWDPTVLQFTSVSNYNLLFLGNSSFGQNFTAQGDLLMSWYDGGGNSQTLPDGTTIFQICFTVIGQPGSSTAITIDGDPTPLEVVSAAGGGTLVDIEQTGGSVNVIPAQDEAIGLQLADASVEIGQEACISVFVSDFDNITATDFEINWNPGLLTFAGVGNFNMPGLDMPDFDLTDAWNGTLHVNWSESGGITLPDGTPIFQLCFTNAVGLSFSTDVQFSAGGIANNTGSGTNNIGINGNSGTIVYELPPPPDLVINIGGADIPQGLSFCIPVTVQEFNNITGGFLSLHWDPSVITYDTVHAVELINFQIQNFQAVPASGDAVLVWNSGIPFGLTLPDNSILFELCFTATGSPGSSGIVAVSNFPLVTTFENYDNVSLNINATYGNITIQSAIPPLTADIGEASGAPGSLVCTPVLSGETDGLTSLAMDVTWDGSILGLQEVNGFGLPGMTINDFDLTAAASGSIHLDWNSMAPQGVDVSDQSVLFNLCFNLIADDDVVAIVTLSNGVVTTVNSNQNNIGLNGIDGSVTIVDNLIISNALTSTVDCAHPDDGTIDLSVAGGTAPYFYIWNNNSTDQDLSNLSTGTYNVTVTDSSIPVKSVTGSYTITGDFIAPVAFVLPPGEITCLVDNVLLDGSFSTSGSVINYSWATDDGNILAGQQSTQALVNKAGVYQFTVLNTINGCFNQYSVPVSADTVKPDANLMALDTINCANTVASLLGDITSPGNNYTFEWFSFDGHFIEGTTGDMHPVVDVATTYYLIGINTENGCTDTASVLVHADFELPVVTATVNGMLECDNESISIDASGSSTGSNFSYAWNTFEGNFTCCEETLTPEVDAPGMYFLTVTNNVNFCQSMTSVLVMADPTVPIALIQPPGSLSCSQTSLILDASNSTTGTAFNLQWSTTDGLILNGQTSPVPMVGSAGTYQLVVSYIQGGCQDTAWVEVTEDMDFPAIEAGPDLFLTCIASEVVPGASGDGQPVWSTTDGSIMSGEDTYSPVLGQAGTYILTVTGDNGCIIADTVLVDIDVQAPVSNAGNDVQLTCQQTQMTLDATATTSTGNVTYLWTTNDGIIISGGNTLFPVVASGTYTLEVTNNGNGCTAADAVTVSAYVLPAAAFAGDDQVVCATTTQLNANLPAGVTGYWSSSQPIQFDNPASANASVSGLVTGDNILIWTLSAGDCPDYSSDEVIISVSAAPVAFDDVYSLSGGDSILIMEISDNDLLNGASNITVSITVLPEIGTITDLGDNVFQYIAAPGFSDKVDFLYSICNPDCEWSPCDTGFVRINIIDPPAENETVVIPNGITPNGDGRNDVLIFNELELHPEDYPDAELIVFNRWGDVVFKKQPYQNDWSGNADSGMPLPEGTYYYVLRLSLIRSEYHRGDITIIR